MKKTLLILAAMLLTLGANAQLFFDPAYPAGKVSARVAKSSHKAMSQGEIWYGYYNSGDFRGGLGTTTGETYDVCAYFSGSNAGKTIEQVRFYLRSLSGVKDVKLWVSKTLPTSADAADVEVQSLSNSDLNGGDEDTNAGYYGKENVVSLKTPYTIGSEGVYVGYSFNVSKVAAITNAGGYPVVLSQATNSENGFYLKTSSNITSWMNAGKEYGDLCLQLLLSGEFPEYSAEPADFGDMFVALDNNYQAAVKVTNTGLKPIERIEYSVFVDGEYLFAASDHFNPALSTYGQSGNTYILLPAASTSKKQNITFTVTSVNGEANEAADASSEGVLNTVPKLFTHRPVIEEYTGTGCGYCPRGLLGMDKARQAFGDDFVGIALHQYNSSDPMYISKSNYASVSFSGAPSCRVDRGDEIDPFYGANYGSGSIVEDMKTIADKIAEVGVEITGTWNADKSAVDATATVEAISDGNSYDIEYVLIADDLHSAQTSWDQHNYYYSYDPSSVNNDPDMSRICKGGDLGTEYINDWHFNDVAIASSLDKAPSIGQLSAYSPVESSYTIALPTSTSSSAKSGPTMLEVLDKDKVYVIAIVLRDGKIVNACKAQVTDATAINAVADAKAAAPVMHFSANGQRVAANHRGLTIIRMADGSVKKVIK